MNIVIINQNNKLLYSGDLSHLKSQGQLTGFMSLYSLLATSNDATLSSPMLSLLSETMSSTISFNYKIYNICILLNLY